MDPTDGPFGQARSALSEAPATGDHATHTPSGPRVRCGGCRRPSRDSSGNPHGSNASARVPGPRHPPEVSCGLGLVAELLTSKELEVLGHLAELLTTDQIAQKMTVSVNTVRTHIRNILRKLGVTRRNAAIRRARELGLLED